MEKRIIWLLHFLSLGLLLLFFGCISFPNKPYGGNRHPSSLEQLNQKNPLLVKELGKLPEIQDGISPSDETALTRIAIFYASNSVEFDIAFKEMYLVGKPEVRKYCTPLQALFWISEESLLQKKGYLINVFSLDKLLAEAWNFNPPAISDQQIKEIINGIEKKSFKEQYLKDWKRLGNKKIQEYFLQDLKNGSVSFSKKAEEKIRDIKIENPKWVDFDTVIDRLNAPQLIDYYQRHAIAYRYRPGHGDDLYEAKNVFADKSGHCAQITAFTIYSLKRSGYAAKMHIIDEPKLRSPRGNNHRVTLFEANGQKFVMDNGRTNPKFGIVREQDYSPMLHPYNLDYTVVWNELLSPS